MSKEPPPGAPESEIESPVKEKSPQKRQKSYNFRRHCFTLYHSEYERNYNFCDTSDLIMRVQNFRLYAAQADVVSASVHFLWITQF